MTVRTKSIALQCDAPGCDHEFWFDAWSADSFGARKQASAKGWRTRTLSGFTYDFCKTHAPKQTT